MQTLSNMRRNSLNYTAVNPTYIYFALAIVYGVFSSIFYYATPLIGFCFYYLLNNYHKDDRWLENLFIFIYMIFIEINYGLFLFSFLVFFLLFHRLFLVVIKESIVCKWCLPILYVTLGYVGYYLFNLFLSFILNIDAPVIGLGYIVFILTDICLVFLLL